MSNNDDNVTKAMKVGGAAAAGAAAGYAATAASGLTAVGLVGSGTGIGAPLGPGWGSSVGPVSYLGLYSLHKLFD